MRVTTYQRAGTHQHKVEMEDRIVLNDNILASGYHCEENILSGKFAVFDGVGGLQGSAFASKYSADTISKMKLPSTNNEIRFTLEAIHSNLLKYGRVATTASGIIWNSENSILLFHVGNTRISGLCDGYIRQFTEDMTAVEMLKKQGMDEYGALIRGGNVLTACLGNRAELITPLVVDDFGEDAKRCSKIMLTSDGIHEHVSIDELEHFLQSKTSYDSLYSLADLAVKNGSQDDLSVMVIDV